MGREAAEKMARNGRMAKFETAEKKEKFANFATKFS